MAQPPQFQVPQLPEGEGKQLVELACYSCHSSFNIVTSAGYDTPEEWKHVFSGMVNLSDAQANTIATYLADNFPADESRRPTLVPGDTQVTFREWIVPTLGQRSRDPVEAPDGSIWWTGMWASLVGRLDPDTGDMQEYRLPLAARPHTIVPDAQGNIWAGANPGVQIVSPEGDQIGMIRLPEVCANICFGGAKRNRLFMTASQSLYSLYLAVQGAHIC